MHRTTITDIRTVAVAVADQDRAVEFYVMFSFRDPDDNTFYVVETAQP